MFSEFSLSDRAYHGSSIVGLAVLVAAVYATGMDIPYYADDFELYFPALEVHGTDLFFRTGPEIEFYRPLQNVFLSLIQSVVGLYAVPVHALTLLLHFAVVGLVYEGAMWLGASRRAALLSAVTMGVAQANVAAVLGNDTLSQVGATLFGYLALRLYGSWRAHDTASLFRVGVVLVVLSGAFLFKEAGVAFVLPIVVAEGIEGWGAIRENRWGRLWRPILWGGGVIFMTAGYLAWRAGTGAVSPGVGSEPYQYWFGLNLVRNAGLFGAAAASVIPTTSVAQWAQLGAHLPLAAALLGMAVAGCVVAFGLFIGAHRQLAGGLLLLAGISLAPVLPLNNVSELYVYAAMPPLSILAGLGFDGVLSIFSGWKQVGSVILIAGYFAGQIWGVWQKSALMERTGERTQSVLTKIVDVTRTAPQRASICLGDEPIADTTAYSVYRMPGAAPFRFAEPIIQHLARRPDVAFEVGTARCRDKMGKDPRVLLQLRKDGREIGRLSEGDGH